MAAFIAAGQVAVPLTGRLQCARRCAGSICVPFLVESSEVRRQYSYYPISHEELAQGYIVWLLSLTLASESETVSHSVMSDGLWPTRLLCPWDFPGRNTGADCHFFLQGTFPTQGSNLHVLHWQVDSLPLSHQGSQHM